MRVMLGTQRTCERRRKICRAFEAMWRLRAVLSPFCIAGTMAAANAQSATMKAPARNTVTHDIVKRSTDRHQRTHVSCRRSTEGRVRDQKEGTVRQLS